MKNYSKNPEAVPKPELAQYRVTQENGTERPFQNQDWDSREPGIYVEAASGGSLFASANKFDSGNGSPSFTKPLEPEKWSRTPTVPTE